MNLEGVHANIVDGARLDRQRHERQLNIRLPDAGPAANESSRYEMIGTRRATEPGEPTHAGQNLAKTSIDAIEGDGPDTAMLNHKVGMIIEILADGRQIAMRFNAQRRESRCGANAGQLQN